jgi:hypothetical protein
VNAVRIEYNHLTKGHNVNTKKSKA